MSSRTLSHPLTPSCTLLHPLVPHPSCRLSPAISHPPSLSPDLSCPIQCSLLPSHPLALSHTLSVTTTLKSRADDRDFVKRRALNYLIGTSIAHSVCLTKTATVGQRWYLRRNSSYGESSD